LLFFKYSKENVILRNILANLFYKFKRIFHKLFHNQSDVDALNLCSGTQVVPGYFRIDFTGDADLILNLEKEDLPFKDCSIDRVICTSAINYFTRRRGGEIIAEVHRVLRPGGIARFSTQDLELIASYYVEKNLDFFFQKLSAGEDRFEGKTIGDKFVAWFYAYKSNGNSCKYFYDYHSLELLFRNAGFSHVERMEFKKSRLEYIEFIDNRADQMFFLEAVK
jgi:SAM-dependent methyltransferase